VSTRSNPVEQTWWIIDNPQVPGELITLTAGEVKYALVFSSAALAQEFLTGLNDSDLQLATLDSWVMKDAFLTAAKILGATRVMFNYVRGLQTAQSAALESLVDQMKARIGL
jgi:hypothetical protein